MNCLRGVDYDLPEWGKEDPEYFMDKCNCGLCYVYIEDGGVTFIDIENERSHTEYCQLNSEKATRMELKRHGDKMKTFRWVTLYDGTRSFITLLDVTHGCIVTACGSLVPEGELFHVLVTNPETHEKLTIKELLSHDDGMEAVEKKLFDDGIISEGDVVEQGWQMIR